MKQTPSQTVGPFYSIGLTDRAMNTLVGESTQGERIRIEGRIIDGDGKPVPDAMIEIWQANAAGRYNHPDDKQEKPLDQSFIGWGRSGSEPSWVLFLRDDQAWAGARLGRIRPSAAHQHDRICPGHAGARLHQNLLQRRTSQRNRSGSKFDRKRTPADFDRKPPGRKRQSRLPFRHSSSG